jgi:DNA polymerase-3 subunit delta
VEANTGSGRDDFHPQLLIFMLVRQYRQILLAQALIAEGLSQQEIGVRLGLRDYPLRKTIEQAARLPADRVDAAYRRLLETDVAVKTGVLDIETAFELLIVDLCELAKTPPSRPAAGRR